MPVPPGTMNPAVRLVQGPPGKVLHEENSRTALTMMTTTGEARKLPQFLAAFAATLGALCAGTAFAWSSGALSGLHYDQETSSWIVSGITLGAFFGCIFAGMAADRFGRQRTLLALSLPLLLHWVVLSVTLQGPWMIAGRALGGLAIGAVSVVSGMYVSEIAEPSVRGTLGSFFQLQITIGILLGYIVALLQNAAHMGYVNMSVPVLFAVAFARMPESPVYLLTKGQSERARDALQWLRGSQYDVSEEMASIRHSILEAQQAKSSIKDLFGSRVVVKGMIVALGLMAAQQLSGINAVIFYTADIFRSTGSNIPDSTCAIIVGVIQVLATYMSTVLVDRAGRRVLLLLSSGVMCICLATLGTYFHLKNTGTHNMEGITWLPLVTVGVLIIVFSLGLGPLPWFVVSEIFSSNVKGRASSVACASNWLMAFAVTKIFPSMQSNLGQGGAFFTFSCIAALSTAFIAFMLPETKGKTLEEIQAELSGIKGYPQRVVPQVIDEEEENDPASRTFIL